MPTIITNSCPNCGTIVAGNVLKDHREMTCSGLGCEKVLRFSDLPEHHQRHILDHPDRYTMED